MFATQALAEDALIDAHIRNQYTAGTGPRGVYLCEDCGHYHFTSKGALNEKLKELIEGGKLKRDQEAYRWSLKFKKP